MKHSANYTMQQLVCCARKVY